MNSLKTINNRRLVPRWQNLNDAYDSKEILPNEKSSSKEEIKATIFDEIDQAKKEWLKEKSFLSALEYLEKQKIGAVECDKKAANCIWQLIIARHNFF